MQIIKESQSDAAKIAADFLSAGKVICLATDTVYGLACDASNESAVKKIYQIKGRSKEKPIAILVKDLDQAKAIFEFNDLSLKIAQEYFPKSLTMILKTKPNKLAKNLNQNDDGFLGFRIIKTNFICRLLKEFPGILALTSANFSNQPEIYNSKMIKKTFLKSDLDLLVDNKSIKKEPHSTIVKILDDKLTILRQGKLKINYG